MSENGSEAPEAEEEITEVWTYMGLRLDSGKPQYAWRHPDGEYGHKDRVANVSIGAHVEVTLTSDRRRYTSGPKAPHVLSSRHKDGVEVARWVALDERAQQERVRRSLETKSKAIDPLDELLQPLREVAGRLMPAERRALAARILLSLGL
jgi:hypothetical protein